MIILNPLFFACATVATAINARRNQIIADYWCGPTTGGWCSEDPTFADVNPKVTDIHVSFAMPTSDGTVEFDCGAWVGDSYVECDISSQQTQGKKVLLSIGGAAFTELSWIFDHSDTFAQSAASVMNEWGFDGVSMDIEHLETEEQISQYSSVLTKLRAAIGDDKLLTDAPQCPYIYSGVSGVSGYYNLYINLINEVGGLVDYFFVQEYNNWCNEENPDSTDYLLRVSSDWVNPDPSNNYNGLVSANQFVMGVPASADPKTASSGYFSPATLQDYLREAQATYGNQTGAGVWDALGDVQTYDEKPMFAITDAMADVYSNKQPSDDTANNETTDDASNDETDAAANDSASGAESGLPGWVLPAAGAAGGVFLFAACSAYFCCKRPSSSQEYSENLLPASNV